eukprot:CAMPEP_0194484072 /NCGR_PEP_ID=MMETSP0253-20130528/5505_1 /TAXON_ID=2966 /ORGANISM="Noctiluca scintillans" /LENGTH=468 /DNA_ID=CAMNT_0039323823 /DNA_START=32 /DNA_END=1438 /DNA_ORIENTATION=-
MAPQPKIDGHLQAAVSERRGTVDVSCPSSFASMVAADPHGLGTCPKRVVQENETLDAHAPVDLDALSEGPPQVEELRNVSVQNLSAEESGALATTHVASDTHLCHEESEQVEQVRNVFVSQFREQDTTRISPEIVCRVVEDLENVSTNQLTERETATPAEFVADLDGSTDGTRLVEQLRNVSTDQFLERETANHAPQLVADLAGLTDGHGLVEQFETVSTQCPGREPANPQLVADLDGLTDGDGRVEQPRKDLVDKSHKQQPSGIVPQNVTDPDVATEEPRRVEHLRNVFVKNIFDQKPESLEVQRKAGDQHMLYLSNHERPGCGKQLRIVEVDNGPKQQRRVPTRPVPSADLQGRVKQLKMAFEEHKQVAPASVRAKSEGSIRVKQLRSVFLGNLSEEHDTVPTPRRGPRESLDSPGRVKHLRNVLTSGNTVASPRPNATEAHQSLDSAGRVEHLRNALTRKAHDSR